LVLKIKKKKDLKKKKKKKEKEKDRHEFNFYIQKKNQYRHLKCKSHFWITEQFCPIKIRIVCRTSDGSNERIRDSHSSTLNI
jgi:hypothetical protein